VAGQGELKHDVEWCQSDGTTCFVNAVGSFDIDVQKCSPQGENHPCSADALTYAAGGPDNLGKIEFEWEPEVPEERTYWILACGAKQGGGIGAAPLNPLERYINVKVTARIVPKPPMYAIFLFPWVPAIAFCVCYMTFKEVSEVAPIP
jgi:hypothetical protein